MGDSSIEWTGKTWNPVLGCARVSPGCDRCYAIGVAHRAMQPAHEGLTVRTENGIDWTGEVRLLPERLDEPLRWRKPTLIFPCSMSDLFHRDVPPAFIARVFSVMARAQPQAMADLLGGDHDSGLADLLLDLHDEVEARGLYDEPWPLPNVWLGASVESDRYVFRADHVRRTPAAVRWLSCEPLLGPLPSLDLTGIAWAVVGGESGPGARPMELDWVRDIRDRCVAAGTRLFVKQLGSWQARHPDGWGMSDSKGHTFEEFPEDLHIRDWPDGVQI